jgi:flagellar biosynthesis chaperone FliJ
VGNKDIEMNTKEQVSEWDKVLDEYESSIGLGRYSDSHNFTNEELNLYFTMNRDQIEKQTPEACSEIALRLSQYAFFIQRTLNREIARHNWAEESIKETIADELNNYKGYGYAEKSLQAIKHNEKASALNKIKKYAKQRMDRLSYLANNIKNLSDILLSINKNKVKHGS